ncbi:hypothetical protein Nepgr_008329 [Nepenthes gracilis]|uniref:Uncharacterized protein n=1 Tax=Nepenthes gracilis TaxID=150966 RepID=A0AAD3S8Y1_NEPGR|nr:hypothetical protein Nepgr_008329 [Nepenthes gracilis]
MRPTMMVLGRHAIRAWQWNIMPAHIVKAFVAFCYPWRILVSLLSIIYLFGICLACRCFATKFRPSLLQQIYELFSGSEDLDKPR